MQVSRYTREAVGVILDGRVGSKEGISDNYGGVSNKQIITMMSHFTLLGVGLSTREV